MLSHHHKLIFVHVPKTAGTSLMKALQMEPTPFPHHWRPTGFQPYRDHWNQYFTTMCVRNPWSRVASMYHYARGKYAEGHRQIPLFQCCGGVTFEEFVMDHIHKKENWQIGPCSWWFEDGYDYDYIMRFENIDQDFRHVCSKIGANIQLGKHNISGGYDVEKCRHMYISDAMVKKIESYYAEDIERFGYSFEAPIVEIK
jgi:hypothetical protein